MILLSKPVTNKAYIGCWSDPFISESDLMMLVRNSTLTYAGLRNVSTKIKI